MGFWSGKKFWLKNIYSHCEVRKRVRMRGTEREREEGVDSRNPILSCHSPVIPINCGKTMSQTTQPPLPNLPSFSTSSFLYLFLSLPLPFSTSSFLYLFLSQSLPFSTSSCIYLFLFLPLPFSTPFFLVLLIFLPLSHFLSLLQFLYLYPFFFLLSIPRYCPFPTLISPEPEFLNVYGAQESIPMNKFRQSMQPAGR